MSVDYEIGIMYGCDVTEFAEAQALEEFWWDQKPNGVDFRTVGNHWGDNSEKFRLVVYLENTDRRLNVGVSPMATPPTPVDVSELVNFLKEINPDLKPSWLMYYNIL